MEWPTKQRPMAPTWRFECFRPDLQSTLSCVFPTCVSLPELHCAGESVANWLRSGQRHSRLGIRSATCGSTRIQTAGALGKGESNQVGCWDVARNHLGGWKVKALEDLGCQVFHLLCDEHVTLPRTFHAQQRPDSVRACVEGFHQQGLKVMGLGQ